MGFNSRVKNLQSVQGLSRRATSVFFTPIVLGEEGHVRPDYPMWILVCPITRRNGDVFSKSNLGLIFFYCELFPPALAI